MLFIYPMTPKLDTESFLQLSQSIPMVDVRSPAEFAKGHIPGAINIPIFTNDERAAVGTIYKQQGKDEAVQLGLEYVGPKLKDFAATASSISANKEILLYCWRGGMRSGSMAWLFETIGLKPKLLQKGYKAYRRHSKSMLSQASKLIILSGCTGTGKTDILKQLKTADEQVIDLEGLANHKGSAFGTIGQEEQLPNEQFENNLYHDWKDLDLNKTIWIEDESAIIGRNYIPQELFDCMRQAPVIKIALDTDIRIKRLVSEYTGVEKELLIATIKRIQKRLDPAEAKLAIEAIEKCNYADAIAYVLNYYDKAYNYGLAKRDPSSIFELDLNEDDPQLNAQKLISFKDKITP